MGWDTHSSVEVQDVFRLRCTSATATLVASTKKGDLGGLCGSAKCVSSKTGWH